MTNCTSIESRWSQAQHMHASKLNIQWMWQHHHRETWTKCVAQPHLVWNVRKRYICVCDKSNYIESGTDVDVCVQTWKHQTSRANNVERTTRTMWCGTNNTDNVMWQESQRKIDGQCEWTEHAKVQTCLRCVSWCLSRAVQCSCNSEEYGWGTYVNNNKIIVLVIIIIIITTIIIVISTTIIIIRRILISTILTLIIKIHVIIIMIIVIKTYHNLDNQNT